MLSIQWLVTPKGYPKSYVKIFYVTKLERVICLNPYEEVSTIIHKFENWLEKIHHCFTNES